MRGGARPGAGRPKGTPNKITNTFRDLLLQAANEVGNSEEIGKDGQGGVLGYLKVAAIKERKTFLLMMARILPLKINAEIKQVKEKISSAGLRWRGIEGGGLAVLRRRSRKSRIKRAQPYHGLHRPACRHTGCTMRPHAAGLATAFAPQGTGPFHLKGRRGRRSRRWIRTGSSRHRSRSRP